MARTDWIVPHGCAHVPGRTALEPERAVLAEELAFEHGESYDSYLLLQDGLHYFFSRGDEGVLGFTTWRRHVYVVGGLLTPRDRRGNLLRDFLEFTRANRFEVSFLNVLATDIPVFREEGFQISKIGEEPIIDLQAATWQGSDFAWVRRQENFCLRNGVEVEEVEADITSAVYREQTIPELLEVSEEHLRDTVYGRELSMMVGRVELDRMLRKRLFVARKNGRIEAFVIAIPACGGRVWAVETFRKRVSATRGVITFLIMQVARRLQLEEASFLSLCQVPALRVKHGTPSDSRFVVNGMKFWFDRLPWFYDVPRLYHFKSRFRPAYRECFLATHPKVRCLPLFAFFFKWGIIVPGFSRLPVQLIRRMRKWSHKERLADPETEQYVILDRLPLAAPVAEAEIPELIRA